jgi:hypothetical protein
VEPAAAGLPRLVQELLYDQGLDSQLLNCSTRHATAGSATADLNIEHENFSTLISIFDHGRPCQIWV